MHPFVPPSLKFCIKRQLKDLKFSQGMEGISCSRTQAAGFVKLRLRLQFKRKGFIKHTVQYPNFNKYLLLKLRN